MATTEDIEKLRKKYPARLTRGRAIKLYCKELCCCGDIKSWKECSQKDCFLWNFRLGREILTETKTPHKNDSIQAKNEQKQGVENDK
jgi:hypothetical protein